MTSVLPRDHETSIVHAEPPRPRRAGGGAVWLVTFVDLISLLLAFFVMMYSMSSVNSPDWRAFTAAMQKSVTTKPVETVAAPPTPISAEADRPGRGVDVRYLRRILESGMSRETTLALAVLREASGNLILSLPGDLFFGAGSASVLESGNAALFALAETLSTLDNRIDLVGHSDPQPMRGGGAFASNWGLSLARAAAVADSLTRAGYRKPMTIRGLGDAHFDDINPDLPIAQRYRRARRVDLIIHRDRDAR
jgi:chemotaxis protein MotB